MQRDRGSTLILLQCTVIAKWEFSQVMFVHDAAQSNGVTKVQPGQGLSIMQCTCTFKQKGEYGYVMVLP